MAGELVALNPATLPEIIEALPPRPRDAISLRFYCGLRSDFIWFERLRSPRIPLFSNRHPYLFSLPSLFPLLRSHFLTANDSPLYDVASRTRSLVFVESNISKNCSAPDAEKRGRGANGVNVQRESRENFRRIFN